VAAGSGVAGIGVLDGAEVGAVVEVAAGVLQAASTNGKHICKNARQLIWLMVLSPLPGSLSH
jgi:hypothetical protein